MTTPARPFLPEHELIHMKTWPHPIVDECLWAKLQDQLSDLERIKPAFNQVELWEDCLKRTRMAQWCIEHHGHSSTNQHSFGKRLRAWYRRFRWPGTEDNTFFWHLAHSVDEDLMLLLPLEEVAARGLEIRSLFERNIRLSSLKETWLENGDEGALPSALKTLTDSAKAGDPEDSKILHARQVLRRALHEVNEQTDYQFRQLGINMLMRAWSGFLLFGLLIASALILPDYVGLEGSNALKSPLQIPVLLLFGAAGAVLANILSKDAFLIAMGPARRYFFYYLFAKPVQGAFAALTFYILLKSELLFALARKGDQNENSAVVFQVTAETEAYVLIMLALAAGFSAEKAFGSMINKVLARLFKSAEKTEESPAAEPV